MLPRSLYIHIPWCIQKCPYCDFNSHKSPKTLPESNYIEKLVADFKQDLSDFPHTSIHSVFIGGGTPSLFSAKGYEKLFDALQRLCPWEDEIEITLEANPGTVDYPRFKDYRAIGINRLSLGIQSFNPKHLKNLGRIHDDQQAKRAILAARKAGFDNINLDIMHGLPNQTIEEGLADIEQAISHEPEHLSWYQLTIEPNTVFYSKPPRLPSEEITSDVEDRGLEILTAKGFQRYEISAFCKPNLATRHNLNYWLFGDYFGIGAGAHGKLTTEDGTVYRTQKARQPQHYLSDLTKKQIRVKEDDLLFEFMLNTTRLERPIPLDLITQRTGIPITHFQTKLKEAIEKGLITLENNHWQVTTLGRRYTNNLQGIFLP